MPAVITNGYSRLRTGWVPGQPLEENAAMQGISTPGNHCGSMSTHSRTLFWSACAMLLILACLSAGCSSSTGPAPSAAATQTPASGGNTIAIRNFAFSPSTLTVKAGTTVTWTNDDSSPHQLASDAGSPVAFSSPSLANGASFTFTFSQAGTYPYHCTIHPSMKGTLVVQA